MKKLFLYLILSFYFCTFVHSQIFIIDERDDQTYETTKIGKQTWLTENMNYNTPGSWTYDDNIKNGKKYGMLYIWYDAKYVCPEGWHLPSEIEWQELINYYGGDSAAGQFLRIDGLSSFNAKYAGYRDTTGRFLDLGHDANFWTSKSCDSEDAWKIYIDRGFNSVVQDYGNKEMALSVRCIKNK